MAKTPCQSLRKDGSPLSGTRTVAIRQLLHRPRPCRRSPRARHRAGAAWIIPPTSIWTTATTTASCVSEVAGRIPAANRWGWPLHTGPTACRRLMALGGAEPE